MLSLVEDNGGKYYWDGKQTDCVEGLAAHGFDIVRLRLYNDPGNAAFEPSNRLPKGYQDEEDILGLLYFDSTTESWKQLALLPILPNFSWKVTF